MKVQFKTSFSEDECKKMISEDAESLRSDAKLICDMEEGKKEGYSLRRRLGYVMLRKTLQASMTAAKLIGGVMDWKHIVCLMKSFSDAPPFKYISYSNGICIIEYIDDYIMYVGFAKMKYDDKGAKEAVINTLKKVMKTDDVSVIEDMKALSPLIGGNEDADK